MKKYFFIFMFSASYLSAMEQEVAQAGECYVCHEEFYNTSKPCIPVIENKDELGIKSICMNGECGKAICTDCMQTWISKQNSYANTKCPTCRALLFERPSLIKKIARKAALFGVGFGASVIASRNAFSDQKFHIQNPYTLSLQGMPLLVLLELYIKDSDTFIKKFGWDATAYSAGVFLGNMYYSGALYDHFCNYQKTKLN